jgi:hypothetical protein
MASTLQIESKTSIGTLLDSLQSSGTEARVDQLNNQACAPRLGGKCLPESVNQNGSDSRMVQVNLASNE